MESAALGSHRGAAAASSKRHPSGEGSPLKRAEREALSMQVGLWSGGRLARSAAMTVRAKAETV